MSEQPLILFATNMYLYTPTPDGKTTNMLLVCPTIALLFAFCAPFALYHWYVFAPANNRLSIAVTRFHIVPKHTVWFGITVKSGLQMMPASTLVMSRAGSPIGLLVSKVNTGVLPFASTSLSLSVPPIFGVTNFLPVGATNSTLYIPATTSLKRYLPFASVVVVAITAPVASNKLTVTPATGVSDGDCLLSPSTSVNT